MSQASTWNVPTSGPGTMSAYAGRANPAFDAILTHHSGASRPSYAVAHSTWLKIVSSSAWELYLYDGADDILIGTFNPTTNAFTLQSSGLGFATSLVMRTDTTPLTFANGRIVATREATGEATLELKGKTGSPYDASGVEWTNGNTAAKFFDLVSNGATSIKLRDSASADVLQFLATGDINSKLWGNLAEQIVQPGTIQLFPFTSAPTGWLIANGALLSRTTYARLWAAASARGKLVVEAAWSGGAYGAFSTGDLSTTFRIPSLNGYFLRAVYNEAGYAIGTYRADANKSHSHGGATATGGVDHNHSYSVSASGVGTYTGGFGAISTFASATTGGASQYLHAHVINADGSSEGEPRNIPLLACIKY